MTKQVVRDRGFSIGIGQNEALLWLLHCYAEHKSDPDSRQKSFAALRALAIVARWFDFSSAQTAMIWELGRADQNATALFQLIFRERPMTRARSALLRQEDVAFRNLKWRRFLAMMEEVERGHRLEQASQIVAGKSISGNLRPITILREYRAIARAIRLAGKSNVILPGSNSPRIVALPRSGRPPRPKK